ncbi:MAG TPA: hypothetical protein OIM48_04260 [Clostridiaceae bacterium]|nr:hypothetical protein [Clostridia bacterium]HJJ12498.1 hypothetical protein [Clostridiaceae bacterium]
MNFLIVNIAKLLRNTLKENKLDDLQKLYIILKDYEKWRKR